MRNQNWKCQAILDSSGRLRCSPGGAADWLAHQDAGSLTARPRLPAKESAVGPDWAVIAFRIGSLAQLLTMPLEEQVSSDSGIKRCRYFGRKYLSRIVVCPTVIFMLTPGLDAYEDMRAV